MSDPIGLTLPPVERLRPGLWTIPVPLPMNSLRYVFVYVFETDRGPYLVDAGWNTDEAFNALSAGLEQLGTSLDAVQGVLVTHLHPDHYGLAGRVRETSGAWIALHPADARLIHDRYRDPSRLIKTMEVTLRRLGAPVDQLEELTAAAMPVLPFVSPGEPDVLLEDLEKPEVPGWDLLSLWTPGHSPGHLCFWEPRNQVLLSGDHVLPRITSHISLNPQSPANPLDDYLRSLDRVAEYPAEEVFPAHEHRFTDLTGRVATIRAHHEQRFIEAVKAIEDGCKTAWEIASRMTWSRSWEEMRGGLIRRSAVLETVAHLRALEARGIVREVTGEPSHWELLRPSGS
jgi:glyoxylase-like metal-dependent hydrolase (beta-lactamase superfamily II)